MHTWIIGAGGLFGSALRRTSPSTFQGSSVPWQDSQEAYRVLREDLTRFIAETASSDWCIAWAAGQATTSSSSEATRSELGLFERFVQEISVNPPTGRGCFLLTSSAGGIYAGSSGAPFTSGSPPAPLSAYGELKLAQEAAASVFAPAIPTAIVRVSNLYGPGQDLGKLQGVISRLALAAVTREPITMFVPLDTMRDYIFTTDAATRAMHWAEWALTHQESTTRIVASGQSETLGHVIALMNDITRVRIPIASGIHDSARGQAHDLRLVPDIDEAIRLLPQTPLPVGMKRVFMDIRQRHASARLAG